MYIINPNQYVFYVDFDVTEAESKRLEDADCVLFDESQANAEGLLTAIMDSHGLPIDEADVEQISCGYVKNDKQEVLFCDFSGWIKRVDDWVAHITEWYV